MRISVVIPVFNRPTLVCEAISSLWSQGRRPDEVVIVDDGSTDHTADTASKHLLDLGSPERWRVLREPHRGAAAARQSGVAACVQVDAIAFLDSDDLWPEDFLARAERTLDARPALAGVSADRLTQDIAASRSRLDELSQLSTQPLRWMVSHDAGFGSCSVMRTGALSQIGGYPLDEPTGHDIVLFSRLFSVGPWAHLPGQPVLFRRHHHALVGEADHIAQAFTDSNLRHARLYEDVAATLEQAGRLPREVRTAMARRWLSAAKTCRNLNTPTEGLRCLSQARRYRRTSFRAIKLGIQLHRARNRNQPKASMSPY
jgi:glycosyltransferase involved in cell wall biosynthesis